MTGTSSNHANWQLCNECTLIPLDLLVNTGRDETFPDEVRQLVRLNIDRSNDLYECPSCGSLFEWADLPQYYGSGNNDEERLTRLNPEQELTARALLDPNPGQRDGEALLNQAFRILSRDLVFSLLRYSANRHKQAFSGFVRSLVAWLMAEGNGTLFDVISTYCDSDRGRLTEVLGLLDAGGADLSHSAQYLRKTCVERLARANRFRPN